MTHYFQSTHRRHHEWILRSLICDFEKTQLIFSLVLTIKGNYGNGGGYFPPEPIIQPKPIDNPGVVETNPCVSNSTHYFQCTHRRHECIPRSLLCDGEFDCTDGSDEFTCRQRRGTKMHEKSQNLILVWWQLWNFVTSGETLKILRSQ